MHIRLICICAFQSAAQGQGRARAVLEEIVVYLLDNGVGDRRGRGRRRVLGLADGRFAGRSRWKKFVCQSDERGDDERRLFQKMRPGRHLQSKRRVQVVQRFVQQPATSQLGRGFDAVLPADERRV